MSRYRTYNLQCRAWVEERGVGAYLNRCTAHGHEIEPGGYVLCFDHRVELERAGCLRLYTDDMLIEDTTQ